MMNLWTALPISLGAFARISAAALLVKGDGGNALRRAAAWIAVRSLCVMTRVLPTRAQPAPGTARWVVDCYLLRDD